MRVQEIVTIAKEKGIKPGKRKKTELIRFIQAEEGNFACYASAHSGECDQRDCLWREDCLSDSKKLEFKLQ